MSTSLLFLFIQRHPQKPSHGCRLYREGIEALAEHSRIAAENHISSVTEK